MIMMDRTIKALGHEVVMRLKDKQFCIVGCGGTGAIFAEMLVRSGAERLTLIDGRQVKDTDLNRVFGYLPSDVGRPKVEALKNRLEIICPAIKIYSVRDSFRSSEELTSNYLVGQHTRDKVHDAEIVFIATDTNRSRLEIEKLCHSSTQCAGETYLSCGIQVDKEKGEYSFECNVRGSTPFNRVDEEGYGPENASYGAIVLEATTVAFTMLISYLKSQKSNFKSYLKRYDENFVPVEIAVNGKSMYSTQLC